MPNAADIAASEPKSETATNTCPVKDLYDLSEWDYAFAAARRIGSVEQEALGTRVVSRNVPDTGKNSMKACAY